jgi:hypothetical protein
MAVNNNGNLLDSAGEVAIDFVWGNFPIQPNDARPDAASATLSTSVTTRVAGHLDAEADNHIIALSGWGGYPQFTANSAGEDVAGDTLDYVLVPSVLGLTTALATDAMKDASLVPTTATAATNVAGSITDIDRTAGSTTVQLTGTGFVAAYPVGTKITVASTGTVDGTWTVTGGSSTDKITFTSNASTVLTSGTGSIIGVAGTIKTQSVAAGANTIAIGAAVTITPWAAAS